MIFRPALAKILIALLLTTLATGAAEQWTRFSSQPESKVQIDGDGSLHSWKVQGSVINGSLEAGRDFPLQPHQEMKPGKIKARIEVAVPVASLAGPNKIETRWLQHGLKMESHPDIVYQLKELILKTTPASEDLFYDYEANGTLAVAGVTNKISLPLRITPLADKRLKITGTAALKLTDFKIKPPVVQLAQDSTGKPTPEIQLSYDDISVTFEWLLAQEPAAPPKK